MDHFGLFKLAHVECVTIGVFIALNKEINQKVVNDEIGVSKTN